MVGTPLPSRQSANIASTMVFERCASSVARTLSARPNRPEARMEAGLTGARMDGGGRDVPPLCRIDDDLGIAGADPCEFLLRRYQKPRPPQGM